MFRRCLRSFAAERRQANLRPERFSKVIEHSGQRCQHGYVLDQNAQVLEPSDDRRTSSVEVEAGATDAATREVAPVRVYDIVTSSLRLLLLGPRKMRTERIRHGMAGVDYLLQVLLQATPRLLGVGDLAAVRGGDQQYSFHRSFDLPGGDNDASNQGVQLSSISKVVACGATVPENTRSRKVDAGAVWNAQVVGHGANAVQVLAYFVGSRGGPEAAKGRSRS